MTKGDYVLKFDIACLVDKCGGDRWYACLYQINIRVKVGPSMSKVGHGRCTEEVSSELCFLHGAQREVSPLMRHFHLV